MKEEHHEQIQIILSKVSKFLIIIPAVIILIAFSIGTRDKDTVSQQTTTQAQVTQAPVKIQPSSANVPPSKLDIKGPLVCDYTTTEMSAGIFVKNRKIYVQLVRPKQSEEVLVKDDCVYRWVSGQTQGQRTCGIGSYLTLFDTLSSFGMLNVESLMTSLSQLTGKTTTISPPPATEVAKSCAKKDIPDTQFTVPTMVTFIDTPLQK